jgi:hypothetical protein
MPRKGRVVELGKGESEVEELKRLVSNLREEDMGLVNTLGGVAASLGHLEQVLNEVAGRYLETKRKAMGPAIDFYDFVYFNVMEALGYAGRARRRVQEVLKAYEGRGVYWEGVEDE